MPANTIKVDRATKWGNPFIVGKHGSRERCVDLYEKLMAGYICLGTGNYEEQKAAREYLDKNMEKLRGKNLACWCRAGDACHADILLKIVNSD